MPQFPMPKVPATGSSIFGYLHIGLAVVVTLGLFALIWLWHPAKDPALSPETTVYRVFYMSIATMLYLAVQAYATLHQPVGAERRVLADILLSALPLLLILYAGLDILRGNLKLNLFQSMSLWQWGVATAIDVLVYSSFSLRIIRRSSEVNVAR